ncbi:MAG: response regulator [Nitrospiraceae bacterium]
METCESATAALNRITAVDYDAIVSDIKMPGMNDLALMERVQTLRPTTPTLLVIGHGDHDFGIRALKSGAYAFIQKPIDRDYFTAWLKRAIQLRQLSRVVEEQNQTLERSVQDRTAELARLARKNGELKAALAQQRESEERIHRAEAARLDTGQPFMRAEPFQSTSLDVPVPESTVRPVCRVPKLLFPAERFRLSPRCCIPMIGRG